MSMATTTYTPETVLAGETIISADSHIQEPEDLWIKNLRPSLKSRYPDFPKRNSPGEKPGGWDPKARMDDDLVRMKALLEEGKTRAHQHRVELADLH